MERRVDHRSIDLVLPKTGCSGSRQTESLGRFGTAELQYAGCCSSSAKHGTGAGAVETRSIVTRAHRRRDPR